MINENGEKAEMTKEDKLDSMQGEIMTGILEVKDLLPELGHGEAKRLLIAAISYPFTVEDFSNDSDSMKKAYSACMRTKDAMIAVATEVTIENMVKQAMENGDIKQEEVTTNEAFSANVGETNEEK
jgi:hypothetical protein